MKIAVLIARILLGLEFVIFGLNGFLGFLHMPPPQGIAGQFLGAIFVSHYSVLIFGLQLISGLLLLSGRYVPLAVAILAGILVNVVAFHATMAPAGLPLALITVILWFVVFYSVRRAFAGIFAARV
jgi:putative oxidoreductase